MKNTELIIRNVKPGTSSSSHIPSAQQNKTIKEKPRVVEVITAIVIIKRTRYRRYHLGKYELVELQNLQGGFDTYNLRKDKE